MADQMGPPFYKCIQPMCWKDVNGSGIITGEPLTDHITPNTVIRLPKSDFSGAKIGDITLYREESRPNLTSAVLKTTTYGSGGGWTRDITGPQDDDSIPFGYMTMGRPVPDPDTHFNSFAQDLLKAGIPAGLRPAVGPASLMPSPTGSCEPEPSKCLLVVPVSIRNLM